MWVCWKITELINRIWPKKSRKVHLVNQCYFKKLKHRASQYTRNVYRKLSVKEKEKSQSAFPKERTSSTKQWGSEVSWLCYKTMLFPYDVWHPGHAFGNVINATWKNESSETEHSVLVMTPQGFSTAAALVFHARWCVCVAGAGWGSCPVRAEHPQPLPTKCQQQHPSLFW